MSGYSNKDWPEVIDNKLWTEKAYQLRATFDMPPNLYAACHVEAQLLAYLVDRHSLHVFEDKDQDMSEMVGVIPTQAIKAVITVNKPDLCEECSAFFVCFKKGFTTFKIEFRCVGDSAPTPIVRL